MAKGGVRFEGGEKLDKLFKNAGKGAVKGLEVGFFESAQYDDGTQVAAVAAGHELGINVPERPFFTIGLEEAKPKVFKLIKAEIDPKTLAMTPGLAGRAGTIMQGEVQRAIRDLKDPPNAPSTIRAKTRKGSKGEKDNPLIDTALMLQSATHKVIK